MSALFGKLCRTCLDTPEHLYPFQTNLVVADDELPPETQISGQMIRELLVAVTNATIDLDTELPEQICEDCLKELMAAKTFLDKCEKSESALKNMLNTSRKTSKKDKKLTKYRISHGEGHEKEDMVIEKMEDSSDVPHLTGIPEAASVHTHRRDVTWATTQSASNPSDGVEDEKRRTRTPARPIRVKSEGSPKILNAITITAESDTVQIIEMPKDLIDVAEVEMVEMEQEEDEHDNDMAEDEEEGDFEDIHVEEEGEAGEDEVEVDIEGGAECEEYVISGEDIVVKQTKVIRNADDREGSECPDCGVFFIRGKSLQRHRLRYHSQNEIEAVREAEEAPRVIFKCGVCNVTFAHKKTLVKHQKLKDCGQKGTPKYSCSVCEREFIRINALAVHLKIHQEAPQQASTPKLICTVCPDEKRDEFPTVLLLADHVQQHIASSRHICSYCERCFNMYSSLKDHLRTHTGDRPFVCPLCGKAFSQSTNLKQHVKRHEQRKDYKCTPPCTASFVSKGELETHMRKHTGEQPFVCECGMKFTTSSSMVKHKRKHTGEKPYHCEQCPERFIALYALKRHVRVTHESG